MIDKNYMRDEVQSLLHRERWDTVYKLTVDREKEMKQLFTGMMNSDTWELKIVLDEKFESKEAEVLAKTKLQVDEPYQKLARALARHELGHWMHCPLDASYVPLLFDAVSNGLKEASFDESEIAQSAPYVMNMFSDTLVNMLEGKDSEYSEGQTTIYNTFFYTGMDRSGHVPEYFSMFVDTWMNFIGKSKVERNLVKDFAGDYKKVEAVSRELLESIMGKTLAERTISNSLNEVEREQVRDTLRDTSKWHKMAQDYARIMAPYVKDEAKDMEGRISLTPMIGKMMEGEGRKQMIKKLLEGKGKEDQNKDKSQVQPGPGPEQNGDYDRARRMINKAKRHLDDPVMDNFQKYEVFDEAYKMAAGEIVLKFIKPEGVDEAAFPMFYTKTTLTEKLPGNTNNIDWGRTMIVNDSKMLLSRKENPFTISGGMNGPGSFEDIVFIVDNSGSMGWEGRAFDDSKYDMALRAIYSSLNYLEKCGKAPYIRYGVLQFGWRDRTTWSGWVGYNELDTFKSQLFEKYQNSGETVLDPGKVSKTNEDTRRHFLGIMVSDGELHNAPEAAAAVNRVIGNNNDFILLQIQQDANDFSRSIARAGATIVKVDEPKDLVGLTLTVVKNTYAPENFSLTMLRQDSTSAQQTRSKSF